MPLTLLALVLFALLFFAFFSIRVIKSYFKMKDEMINIKSKGKAIKLPEPENKLEDKLYIFNFKRSSSKFQLYRRALKEGGLYFTPLPEEKLSKYTPGIKAKEILIVKDSPRNHPHYLSFKITDLSGILQEIMDYVEEGWGGAVVLNSFDLLAIENEPYRIQKFLLHLKELTQKDHLKVIISLNRSTMGSKHLKIFKDVFSIKEMD